MNLEHRTFEQLLADFDGQTEPALKMLNLIYSVYQEIGSEGSSVAWDDVTGKPDFGDLALLDQVGAAQITDLSITNAEISASAAIALSKLATGALPTAITVASANLVNGAVADAKVSASANIALSKLANVAAGTDGLAAGTLQATFQALATRIQALEDAAP